MLRSTRAKCSAFCFGRELTHTHTCPPDSPPIAPRSTADERRRKRAKNVRPPFGPRGGRQSFSAPSRSPVSRTATRGGSVRSLSSLLLLFVNDTRLYNIILYRSKTPTTRILYYYYVGII